ATAGSGDVLTGIITSLVGQGYSPKLAAIIGVFLHGMAGDIAAEQNSKESLIATDIIEFLGDAYKRIKSA
ncbi:MAG: NAD(P)H-hydrate dehydratase, partial [Bacteroidales bacterium]